MKSAALIFTLLSSLFVVFSASALPSTEGWQRFTSEHFVLYSTQPREQVLSLVKELEILRLAVQQGLNFNDNKKLQRPDIYLLSSEKQLKYFVNRSTRGFYKNTVYGPQLVVGPSLEKGLSQKVVLYHEYIH